jgi:hypothetical protein
MHNTSILPHRKINRERYPAPEGVSDLVIPHQIAPPKLHNIRALIVGAV